MKILLLLLIILFSICIFGCELSDDYYLNKLIDIATPNATASEREAYKKALKIELRRAGYTPKEYYELYNVARNIQQ